MSNFTFEDYLKTIHAEDYTRTDDDMSDAFETWLADLDQDELIQHAENAIKIARGDL